MSGQVVVAGGYLAGDSDPTDSVQLLDLETLGRHIEQFQPDTTA